MKNIVLIHGIGGYKKESYFGWLKNECEKLGLKVYIPQMPSWRDGGTYQQWFDIFDKQCSSFINKETIILAQSLGTQFIVKYLVSKNKIIGGYISCAGMRSMQRLRNTPDNIQRAKDFDSMAISFLISNEEYSVFKSLDFPKFSFYSNNDNFFEQSNLEGYISEIGSVPKFIKGKGHFSILAGVQEHQEALEIIKALTNPKATFDYEGNIIE